MTSKTELLRKLQGVVAQRGSDGATLQHLAAATRLSRATLYHHFPGGKEEIIAQLVRLAISDLQKHAFSHLIKQPAAKVTPAKQLRRFVQGFAAYAKQQNYTCLLATLTFHDAAHDHLAAHQAIIHQQMQDWEKSLVEVFIEYGHGTKKAKRQARGLLSDLYGTLASSKLMDRVEDCPKLFARLERKF